MPAPAKQDNLLQHVLLRGVGELKAHVVREAAGAQGKREVYLLSHRQLRRRRQI